MKSMAEPKRLQITTVNSSNSEEKRKTPQFCDRFTLSLSASTDTTCPEFSYTELVKNTRNKERDKSGDGTKNSDPFGDDEDPDEIAAIARKFEEKYGHVDLGEGYDETDEFIDNSEAYDEVLPAYMSTKLGGFYINSGKLDFKEVSEDSREEFQTPVKKKKKKRLITSDSDSDDEEKKKKIKKRKLKDGVEGEKKKKKHVMNGDAEKPFKKPKKPIDKEKMKKKKMSPTVAELLKQQTESTSNTSSLANGITDQDMDVCSPNMVDGNDSSSDAVIANKEDSNSRDGDDEKKSLDPATIPKLPPGIPSELEQTIDKLKEAAKNSSVGKSKFFTNSVNKILLDVEMGCRQLSCGNRSAVYAHLAVFLPCGKETLKTRAKKLRENLETDLLREPMQKLREALGKVVPPMLEKYEAECQKLSQMRVQEKEKEEPKEEKEGGTEDIDNNEDKSNLDSNKKKLPPKKFEWNNEIRTILCEVVRIKLKIYDSSKTRVQGAEEFLKGFLEREIKPLWPKGWMQTRVLFRESKMAHAAWTTQKPKKTVIITKTTPTVVSSVPTTPTNTQMSKTTPGMTIVKTTPVSNGVSMKQATATPSLPASAKSVIPTLLDYAEKESKISATTATTLANAAKSEPALSSGGQTGSASSGLSLLAASAAKQQYLDKSWDHVVSDILRSSFSGSDEKGTPTTPSGGDARGSFLDVFQKYASSSIESKLKDPKIGTGGSGSMVAKQPSPQQQQQQQKLVAELIRQNQASNSRQNQASNQDLKLQQLKAEIMAQNKQVLQQQAGDKLKLATQQKADIKQLQQPGAQQRTVKAIKVTQEQHKQIMQNLGQSGQKPGHTVISMSSDSKGGSQRPISLLDKDQIYRKLLEGGGVTGMKDFKSPTSQISPTSLKNTQNVPATIILTNSSGKAPQQQRVGSMSLTKVVTANRNSGSVQRPSPGQISPSQVTRTSPLPPAQGQRLSQGQNPLPKVSLNSSGNNMYSNSNGQSRSSGTATNLLQQLFEANSPQSHPMQKQMTSPVRMQGSPQKSPQGSKPAQSQIWSMSSIASSANNSGQSSGYSSGITTLPKSIPGYQSVRIGNISKDMGTPGQLQRTNMHNLMQGTYGGNQTSPVSPTQRSPVRMMPGQTSPLQRQSSLELFPPYTSNTLHHQQSPQHHQVSYPTANYRTAYTEKSRSPHGYS